MHLTAGVKVVFLCCLHSELSFALSLLAILNRHFGTLVRKLRLRSAMLGCIRTTFSKLLSETSFNRIKNFLTSNLTFIRILTPTHTLTATLILSLTPQKPQN